MRSLIVALSLLFTALPLAAADDPATAVQLPAQDQRVELGAGIAMPSDVFTDRVARPDGLATLERMRTRAERARELEGVPHLIVLLKSVALAPRDVNYAARALGVARRAPIPAPSAMAAVRASFTLASRLGIVLALVVFAQHWYVAAKGQLETVVAILLFVLPVFAAVGRSYGPWGSALGTAPAVAFGASNTLNWRCAGGIGIIRRLFCWPGGPRIHPCPIIRPTKFAAA